MSEVYSYNKIFNIINLSKEQEAEFPLDFLGPDLVRSGLGKPKVFKTVSYLNKERLVVNLKEEDYLLLDLFEVETEKEIAQMAWSCLVTAGKNQIIKGEFDLTSFEKLEKFVDLTYLVTSYNRPKKTTHIFLNSYAYFQAYKSFLVSLHEKSLNRVLRSQDEPSPFGEVPSEFAVKGITIVHAIELDEWVNDKNYGAAIDLSSFALVIPVKDGKMNFAVLDDSVIYLIEGSGENESKRPRR